eukprot:scaffold93232_cov35-Tisochrysis_lutea.AAC.1
MSKGQYLFHPIEVGLIHAAAASRGGRGEEGAARCGRRRCCRASLSRAMGPSRCTQAQERSQRSERHCSM